MTVWAYGTDIKPLHTVRWITMICLVLIVLVAGVLGQKDPCQTEPTYCSRLRSDECYQNFKECCKTCPQFFTAVQGCEYGDYASVCEPFLCTSDENKEICCLTCGQISTVPPAGQLNETRQPEETTGIPPVNTSPSVNITVSQITEEQIVTSMVYPETSLPTVTSGSPYTQTGTPSDGKKTPSEPGATKKNSVTDDVDRTAVTTGSVVSSPWTTDTPVVTQQGREDKTAVVSTVSPPLSTAGSDTKTAHSSTDSQSLSSSININGTLSASNVSQKVTTETPVFSSERHTNSPIFNQTVVTKTSNLTYTKEPSATSTVVLNKTELLPTTAESIQEVATRITAGPLDNSTTSAPSASTEMTSSRPAVITDAIQDVTTHRSVLNEVTSTVPSVNYTQSDNSTETVTPGWSTKSKTPLVASTSNEAIVQNTTPLAGFTMERTVNIGTDGVTPTLNMENTTGTTPTRRLSSNSSTTDTISTQYTGSAHIEQTSLTSSDVDTTFSLQNQTTLRIPQTHAVSEHTVGVTVERTYAASVSGEITTQPRTDTEATDCKDLSINGLTCQNFIAKHGVRLCYEVDSVCCETCERIRHYGDQDCPYGDQTEWCVELPRSRCYHLNSTCCASCSQYRRGPQGCEYGDRAPVFCKTIMPWECYEYPVACCETCSAYRAEHISNCLFGDRAEEKICQRYLTAGCLEDHMRETCCKTCWNIEPP